MVGLLETYMVLRLIRICGRIRAPPDTASTGKLFAINFIANTRQTPVEKNSRKNFLEFGLQTLISGIVEK